MAEALNRTPPASRYSADMSEHVSFGTDATLAQHDVAYGRTLQGVADCCRQRRGDTTDVFMTLLRRIVDHASTLLVREQ